MIGFGNNNNNNSSWWLGGDFFKQKRDNLTGKLIKNDTDLIKLDSYRRAISNFVTIVTGQNIPVSFSDGDDSATDGKEVIISSKINEGDFDSTVGLALHEGSHIKLSDFNVIKKLAKGNGAYPDEFVKDAMQKYKLDRPTAEKFVAGHLKNLLNYVEDRRIDHEIFTKAPGYKGYYHSMYNRYFNAPIIDQALQSEDMRQEDWDDYMFRIANLTNENRDLDALQGLRKIFETIDLRNIDRLKNTDDALEVAKELYKEIEARIVKTTATMPKSGGPGKKGEEGDEEGQGGEGGEDQEWDPNADVTLGDGSGSGSGKNVKLSPKQIEQLKKAIQKQRDFMNGQVAKKKLNNKQKKELDAINQAGMELKNVGEDVDGQNKYNYGGDGQYADGSDTGIECIVVQNMTRKLIESGAIDMCSEYQRSYAGEYKEAIDEGLKMGKMLGRKLQVRQEEKSLKYNRLAKGQIDNRLVAELGFGNTKIFDRIETTAYNPSFVHISIDASGSMSGDRFYQAQVCAVAIAKACSMLENLDCTISYRGCQDGKPCMLIAYDSRKDPISKIKSLFQYIDCPSSTPEGLCFEAILDQIEKGTQHQDSYFINLSDGQPGFHGDSMYYGGSPARQHTARMIKKMKERGVKILSYFVGSDGSMNEFREMYGRDSENIDVKSVTQIAKTMNKRFLSE